EMVTVYDRPAASGADGIKRMVTGSRHSSFPAMAGSTRRMVVGSTTRSSDPATGRSNVTAICARGFASPLGNDRVTRGGVVEVAVWASDDVLIANARSSADQWRVVIGLS